MLGRHGRRLLRPYELLVVDAVAARLEPEAGRRLMAQVDAVGHVQRLSDDREVDLYPARRGVQARDDGSAFANRADEFRLATVTLRGDGLTTRVTLTTVRGHLFQLQFSSSPKVVRRARSIAVEKVVIHADPMTADHGEAAAATLARLHPATREELANLWAGDGTVSTGVARGADDLYAIDLDGGEYVVLGQLPDTSILFAPVDAPTPRIVRSDPGGDDRREYPSLVAALHAGAEPLVGRT